MTTLDNPDIGYVAVGIDYEATGHAPFYALLICVGRVLAVFVDIVEERFVAAGKGWLNFHIIVFKHLEIGGHAVGRAAY